MGRRHRNDFEYVFHHVFNRASARKMIFRGEVHRHAFLDTLEHVVKSEDIQVSNVVKVVSKHYGIDERNILCAQHGVKNHPRNVALYFARAEAGLKVHEVAKDFSISRTAVSSAVSRLERQLQIEPSLKTKIAGLRLVIRSYRIPSQMNW